VPRAERHRPSRELIESGRDLGASLAVTVDREFALDRWGGWADEARTRRWQRHDHLRLLDHQDHGRACRAGAGRARTAPNIRPLPNCFSGIVGG
jgi:hypothetical protein